ncbi:protein-methionine-sulfoxide reductase heme-binding subunit MsrQ [Acetobacter oeni]|uniref:Protein-methionine-sulfoxide reductase heme-binding subunit MsrQ n=1 Tax=Acetobacter oeni TaxID=304077 RepID=A0A511XGG2_9PROT|nr:protein-methionine-sulfoxide reductase heme-binding subunit MsrQ [Acetobacter oeni]MBB3882084.1 sulfoxide reductase heme-binding subunit YedZ [Acetobacter oeni]NHO17849.1 sulfoxide reductase heme-binding subunit YedZ [Acetobacter oeni]GBR03354.1 sulfite oxidase subunit YedZ [Acetobacter oeni LMG 21952]GEN61991.1 protein-methionine-sulfoxide reductase heme-binding subunit MsrQ [Acetobacter oeni]
MARRRQGELHEGRQSGTAPEPGVFLPDEKMSPPVRPRPVRLGSLLTREILLYCFLLIPLVSEVWMFRAGALGEHPVAQAESDLGLWAFRFLLVTLAITPLRRYGNINLVRWRRVTGLLAFTYALFHVGFFVVVDRKLAAGVIFHDILAHYFIPFGVIAFLILSVLAVTSQRASVRVLGRKWRVLHRGVYVAAFLVAVHYLLSFDSIRIEPIIYAALTLILLATRLDRDKKRN